MSLFTVNKTVSEYDKILAVVAAASIDTSMSVDFIHSIIHEIVSEFNIPLTHCLSQHNVCNAPKISLKHNGSSIQCSNAADNIVGTPVEIACGLNASSNINNFTAFTA